MARWARAEGLILRFIEYMDVGHSNGWRLDEVVPAAELIADDLCGDAPGGAAAELPRRGRRSLALRRRHRRGRRHRLGHPAVLRRLHAGPAVGRRAALHVPVRGEGHDLRALLRSEATDAELGRRSGRSGGSGPTATRSSARPPRPTCPGSRCSLSGARQPAPLGGSPLHLVHRPSRRPRTGGQGRGGRDKSVDKRVDPPDPPYRRSCRRGRQGPGHGDHIKGLLSGRFGRSPCLCGGLTIARRRPAGRDRHPGVDTLLGRANESPVRPAFSCPTAGAGVPCGGAAGTSTLASRLDPAHRSGRATSRPASRARGGRPRPDRPRAAGRDRPRVGPGRLADEFATRSRSRSPTCPAGRRRPHPDTSGGSSSAGSGGAGRHAPGRLHVYEGSHPGLVVQPVLLMGRLGATAVVLTNAAGGVDRPSRRGPSWSSATAST